MKQKRDLVIMKKNEHETKEREKKGREERGFRIFTLLIFINKVKQNKMGMKDVLQNGHEV